MKDVICKVGISGIADRVGMAGKSNLSGWCIFFFRRKGEVDMALGNVIGSNIFNILMVLGIAAAISPVAFLTENIIDIAVLIVFSVIGWIMAWTKRELNRKEGIIMLLLYAVYVVYICMR